MTTCCPQCQHHFTARKAGTKSPARVKAGKARWKKMDAEARSKFMEDAANVRWEETQAVMAAKVICQNCVHFVPDSMRRAKFGQCLLRKDQRDAEVTFFDSCERHAFKK